ncbi:PAP2 (acid phosphatase) superfamily protein [Serratia rubidaea]|uniref:PAP2 (Acid phosphatase) superfamily protein n=1 Tax=Serratia rubidaea TaxID=61652 RepID=A0A3S4FVK3_SERRU|nr:PAP2 (acid phosphatase) superfamily protein [Serratia rubidaea]
MDLEKPSRSLLNQSSTAKHFKNGSIYSLTPSFYRWQVFGLIVSGLLFLWLSRDERLDWAISNMWFDSASGHFPWQHNVWLDAINHRLLKIGVIAASVLTLLWGIYRRHARLILCMLLVGVGRWWSAC